MSELFVAEEVEDGTVHTLEGVAEQTTSRQPDGKVWVRPNAHLPLVICKKYPEICLHNGYWTLASCQLTA